MLRSALLVVFVFTSSALALVHGVDSATLVSTATYATARSQGFTKAVIRGYQEACEAGGLVDPNFVTSYNNARAAGITNIDTYWVPCSGSRHKCKSYADQIGEIRNTFVSNSMQIGKLWIAIEKDSTICNNWDYGPAGNLEHAQQLIVAIKASGYNYGIYSSLVEWNNVFGSTGVVLDNSVPLWFAAYDNAETLTLGTPFGGWSTANGHQYTSQSASGQFNLNVFVA